MCALLAAGQFGQHLSAQGDPATLCGKGSHGPLRRSVTLQFYLIYSLKIQRTSHKVISLTRLGLPPTIFDTGRELFFRNVLDEDVEDDEEGLKNGLLLPGL